MRNERVTKPDVIDASGSLQVCAGQKSGSEAAIHAMRDIFHADETDAAPKHEFIIFFFITVTIEFIYTSQGAFFIYFFFFENNID